MYPAFVTETKRLLTTIDFRAALMNVMLGFLLFAGAIHIDLNMLKKESLAIFTFSTIGVLISTVIVAALFYTVTKAFGLHGFLYGRPAGAWRLGHY